MGGAIRRPDQAGQDLVLHSHRPMGFNGSGTERVLQLTAGHGQRSRQRRRRSDADAVLPRPARVAVCEHSRPTRAGLPRRFDWYRNTLGAHDRADHVRRIAFNIYARSSEVLPLHDWPLYRRELDRVRTRLGLVSVRCRARYVDRAAHQPPPAGGRRIVADGQLGELRGTGRFPRRSLDSRNGNQLSLRCHDASDRAEGANRAQR